MKYLLEFNEYNEDEFLEIDPDIVDEVKELLFDTLQHDVEGEIPEVNFGYFTFDNLADSYVVKRTYEEPNCIFAEFNTGIGRQFNPRVSFQTDNIQRINKSLTFIDKNLICLFHRNTVIITNKKIIERISAFKEFIRNIESFLDNYYYEDWFKKWEGDVEFSESFLNRQTVDFRILFHHNYLKISFYVPDFSINGELKELETSMSVKDINKVGPAFSILSEMNVLKDIIHRAGESTNGFFPLETSIGDWLQEHIFIHLKTQKSIALDNIEQKLEDIPKSGLDLDYDDITDIVNAKLEVLIRYKSQEKIITLQYDIEKEEMIIFDEFDKEIERCNLDSLEESLFLFMTENM